MKKITGNYFNKYDSSNPLVKFVMSRYFSTLSSFIEDIEIESILDLGCGEGHIIKFLEDKLDTFYLKGYDIDKKLIDELNNHYKKYDFEVSFLDSDFKEEGSYDLTLLLEVLEHIKDYKKVLSNLKKINTKHLIISVPNEPFFRLANISRLKYLKRLGNTPGHVNNFTYFYFKKLIKKNFPNSDISFKTCYIWNFAFIKK